MKKIRLDPEDLEVHSFATLPERAHRTGTIRGHQDATQAYTCVPTEAFTCLGCPDPNTDPLSIGTFCTNGGSCIDGPCKADSRMSQCVC